jgi:hypothetical protein
MNKQFTEEELEIVEGEVPVIEAANVMLGTMMQSMIDMAKGMPDVWQKMGQDDQDVWIQHCDARCRDIVRSGVAILATGNHESIPAVVEQVVFKDGVKVVLKINGNREGAHAIADCEGNTVAVIVADSDEYLTSEGRPESDEDQGSLQLNETGDAEQ